MSIPTQSIRKLLKEIAYDMHVLLVEDDLEIQQYLKTFLSRFLAHIDTANNGKEALTLYIKDTYDLIITDLTMPIMGGIKLSQEIRKINNDQKIVIISAHSESERLIELINIGIDGFMLKPINAKIVLAQLYKTSQAIYNQKMLKYLNTMLKESNKELREKKSRVSNST